MSKKRASDANGRKVSSTGSRLTDVQKLALRQRRAMARAASAGVSKKLLEALRRGESLVCTVPEAGAVLGKSAQASYKAARRGTIPTIPDGSGLLVPLVELEKLVGEKRVGS